MASRFADLHLPMTVFTVALVASLAVGCGSGEGSEQESSSTVSVEADQSAEASSTGPGATVSSTIAAAGPVGDDAGSTVTTSVGSDVVTTQAEAGGKPDATPLDAIAGLLPVLEDGAADPPTPATGADAYLGGSPDAYATAAITLGLEAAGADITGVSVSVLPIAGGHTALLVLEIGDAYVESGLLTATEVSDLAETLLSLAETETAQIVELVTVYRGIDEQGPFTLTFAVSMDALRNAYTSSSELGDALLVQVDRTS